MKHPISYRNNQNALYNKTSQYSKLFTDIIMLVTLTLNSALAIISLLYRTYDVEILSLTFPSTWNSNLYQADIWIRMQNIKMLSF